MMRKSSLVLKPQDIITLLKLSFYEGNWIFSDLSRSLAISASELHSSLERCAYARLYNRTDRSVHTPAILTFLVHGARYAFPAHPGPIKRGIPTAWSVPPLLRQLPSSGMPYIWPSANGTTDGISITPLYRSVPQAILTDRPLYRALAVVDALRVGGDHEQAAATQALKAMLQPFEQAEDPPAPSLLLTPPNPIELQPKEKPKPAESRKMPPELALLIQKIRALTGTRTQKLYESVHMSSVIIHLDQHPNALQQLVHIDPATHPEIQAWSQALIKNPEHRFIMKEHLPRGGNTSARIKRIREALRAV